MKKQILIIEDEADLREPMADALEQQGYKVHQAEDGKIGLEKALEIKPDVILLDIMMPVMDGHETLKQLRQDPWGRDAKVVIMSAMDDVSNIGGAYQTGITEYVIKSNLSLQELFKKIREVLFMHT